MKTVQAHASHPAHSPRRSRPVMVLVWRPVCVIRVTSSALVSASLLKHVAAPMMAATTSRASAFGLMRLVVVYVSVIRPWAW